jgi:quercetin dioxygenase-like cupin family protein
MSARAILGSLALLAACGPADAQDSVVSMRDEPYHRLVFENRHVTVYDVALPVGALMRFHEHPTNHLAVVIDTGRLENEILGRPPRENPTGASGTIVYLPAGPPHRQRNIGETVVRFTAVELLAPLEAGAAPAPPAGAAEDRRAAPDGRPGCHLALEASDIRAWRCRLAAGDSAPARSGNAPFLRVTPARGSAVWHERGESSATNNPGPSVLEFVDLEWR